MYRPKYNSLDRKKTKYPKIYHSGIRPVQRRANCSEKIEKRRKGNRSKIVCRRVLAVNKGNMPGIRYFWSLAEKKKKIEEDVETVLYKLNEERETNERIN